MVLWAYTWHPVWFCDFHFSQFVQIKRYELCGCLLYPKGHDTAIDDGISWIFGFFDYKMVDEPKHLQ